MGRGTAAVRSERSSIEESRDGIVVIERGDAVYLQDNLFRDLDLLRRRYYIT